MHLIGENGGKVLYICVIILCKNRYNSKNILHMKNKFLAATLLLCTLVIMASCSTSRKQYGCPMATVKVKTTNS